MKMKVVMEVYVDGRYDNRHKLAEELEMAIEDMIDNLDGCTVGKIRVGVIDE
jgi:hypothetical protein